MKRIATLTAMTLLTGTAMAETINFDNDKTGNVPAGWSAGVTGRGSPQWTVAPDATAPSKPNVLKQSGRGTFPYCVLTQISLADGYIEFTGYHPANNDGHISDNQSELATQT